MLFSKSFIRVWGDLFWLSLLGAKSAADGHSNRCSGRHFSRTEKRQLIAGALLRAPPRAGRGRCIWSHCNNFTCAVIGYENGRSGPVVVSWGISIVPFQRRRIAGKLDIKQVTLGLGNRFVALVLE